MGLCELSLRELAALVRDKEVSAREVVDAHLERIDAVNSLLNAVVVSRAEQALAEADELDRALARGEVRGPLHGVPVTIKEMIDTRGDPATLCTMGLKDHRAPADATIVTRLRRAGAIVLGKTNMPEFANGADTENLVYGRTSNPYALDRSAGGSSGGGAAIVAAAGSALDIGNDTGGSLRIPAHYCGIATLRPTIGRIPATGVGSGLWGGLPALFSTNGPLARTVGDLEIAMSVLDGPDGVDPITFPVALGRVDEVALAGLRVALIVDDGSLGTTRETGEAVRRAAVHLADLGATVVERPPEGIAEGFDLFADLLGAGAAEGFAELLKASGTTRASDTLLKLVDRLRPRACDLATFQARWGRWDAYRKRALGLVRDVDAILAPVTARPALRHAECMWDAETIPAIACCWAMTLTCFPCAVVRAGTSPEGLPIGVQIVARPWRDDVALAVALGIELGSGGWRPPAIG